MFGEVLVLIDVDSDAVDVVTFGHLRDANMRRASRS